MRYTLRQLEVFIATAHTENISRAAERLSMSQSAASGALKELEKQFSMALFERVGKRLKLSEMGHWIRPKAEALISQAAELESAFHNQSSIGSLRVGATLTIGNDLATEIMVKFLKEHPQAAEQGHLSLEIANTENIVKRVENFEIDLGLIEGELHHPKLSITPWHNDELVVFCAPEHPLVNRSKLSDNDLISHRWILRESGSGTRQTFNRAMHDLLPELQIALELQQPEAIKQSVAAGLGIGCLSHISLKKDLAEGKLVRLPVSRDLHRHFYVVLHKQKHHTRYIQSWLKHLRDT
ncbi:LysR substrate-binding domain-containing protein [Sansalvadorimonas verongulae]|uniref:LysR substrate-binding domain-containing protein n=1 Tax=Sansalvadorimonas verongulae TaxID=2172824 RepID=UPI0012BD06E8|nr:LysR substrate-binding domain-containing protein [Sansalvadorimonas verongulae]MTI12722.1 LysR family transcriptional regulator [Sansalvadorimonas verongulae]